MQPSGSTAKLMIDTGDLLLQSGEKPSDLSRDILPFATQSLHEIVDMSITGFNKN